MSSIDNLLINFFFSHFRKQFLSGTGEDFSVDNLMAGVPGIKRRVLTGSLNELVSMREAAMDIEDYPEPFKRKLTEGVKSYFETGNCNFENKLKRSALNPTLLEPGTLCWRIDGSSCPFDSYLPLHQKPKIYKQCPTPLPME